MPTEDLQFFAATIVITLVLTGVLLLPRRRISNRAWRDVLGISATFVVLGGIGFLMIVGEHALG